MKVLSFGECSKKLIYPFLMAISVFLLSNTREIIRTFDLGKLSNGDTLKFTHHTFYLTWLCYFSKLLFVILFFIQKRKVTNNKKLEDSPEKEEITQIDPTQSVDATKIEKKEEDSTSFQAIVDLPRKAKIKLILLFVALHFCEGMAISASLAVKEIELTFLELIIRGLLILFTMFFSMKILKYKYAKHHFLAITFIILGIFIYSLCECLNLSDSTDNINVRAWISYIICIFIVQILTALQECIEKYMMDYKYLSPYFILSVEGIVGFIVETIILIIVSNVIDCQETNFYCKKNPDINYRAEDFIYTTKLIFTHYQVLLCIIGMIIMYFFFDIFRIKTNQFFSPTHRSIGDTVGSFLFWIVNFFCQVLNWFGMYVKGSAAFNLAYVASYLIIIFGVAIFLELIIFNFCGLNVNTEFMIKKRAKEEEEFLIEATKYTQNNKKILLPN